MKPYLIVFIILFSAVNLFLTAFGLHQCKNKSNTYGITWGLFPLGIFVWGDAVVFGLFWFFVGIVVFILKDIILFKLTFSAFWLVRSAGETIFWFNQQFSEVLRYPPHLLLGHKIFKGKAIEDYDGIWFVNQIINQCVSVISLIATIYFSYRWILSL